MEPSICIHGHFYQPPRENPWLEAIEVQDEARPYHDWNKRITAECYATNAASRILDQQGRIAKIVNNYEKISFNFGPTLLSWLEAYSPSVYEAVRQADRRSKDRFSGHGSALAQAYNHMIMPLAGTRDKVTQVEWGITDFSRRFGRPPEGMWLPETAVDLETLDVMAGKGLRFTILAPRQAGRVRPLGGDEWVDVTGERVDPKRPYVVRLPSGRTMAVFFFDGPISRAVAFERLLASGEGFARRLTSGFSDEAPAGQLMSIATDGESYGHHHRFGDMALAYACHYIESKGLARLTNYGEFLERHPPEWEVEIQENTSWSCAHGVERWRGDCGCNTGAHPEWSQAWRGPLRTALDRLRARLDEVFERVGGGYFQDPWEARNRYIDVVLDRSPESRREFFEKNALSAPDDSAERTMLKLLELQRHAMLMYTSCGWFFDDLSGIETVQILHYAARAMELAGETGGVDLEPEFRRSLSRAESNREGVGNGGDLFERTAKRSRFDFPRVAAHYAMKGLFPDQGEEGGFYCYRAEEGSTDIRTGGKARLLTGHARFVSEITMDSSVLSFGALHLGDHNLTSGVREYPGEAGHGEMRADIVGPFETADFPETLRRFDRHFGGRVYGLKSLFQDEQRRILDNVLEVTLKDVEGVYRRLYEHQVPLMRFLMDAGAPIPRPLSMASELICHNDLKEAFHEEPLDVDKIRPLLQEARAVGVSLDEGALEFPFRRGVERAAAGLRSEPTDTSLLERLNAVLGLLQSLPFKVNLHTVQNTCYWMKESFYKDMKVRARGGDQGARHWVELLEEAGRKLGVLVE